MSSPEEIDLWEVTKQYPIIISDDDVAQQTLMMVMLARLNLFSVANSHPEDTLYLCRHYPVSLVISDMMKPDMSGFELIRTLRGDARTQHLPIIICATRCDKESIDYALELGANDYFCKPAVYPLEKMLPRIRQLVAAAYPGLVERHFDHTWQPDTPPYPAFAPYRVQIPDHEWVGQVRGLGKPAR